MSNSKKIVCGALAAAALVTGCGKQDSATNESFLEKTAGPVAGAIEHMAGYGKDVPSPDPGYANPVMVAQGGPNVATAIMFGNSNLVAPEKDSDNVSHVIPPVGDQYIACPKGNMLGYFPSKKLGRPAIKELCKKDYALHHPSEKSSARLARADANVTITQSWLTPGS